MALTQILLEVGVYGGIGRGPPELAKRLALGQWIAVVVHKAARDAKVNDAPVATSGH